MSLIENIRAISDEVRQVHDRDHSPSEIASLIARMDIAQGQITQEVGRLNEVAADPLKPMTLAEEASAGIIALELQAKRLTNARGLLDQQLTAAKRREDQGRRREAYKSALSARDKAAAELLKEWPKAAAQVVRCFELLNQTRKTVADANSQLPDGAAEIEPVVIEDGTRSLILLAPPFPTAMDQWKHGHSATTISGTRLYLSKDRLT